MRYGQYHLINEILIAWYKKCASANLFPDGPVLKKEAMLIKERLNKDELATFTESNGWLEKFKQIYGLRGTRVTGEADNIPEMTIQSWIERLSELTSGYELRICFSKFNRKKALLKYRRDLWRVKCLNNVLQQPFLQQPIVQKFQNPL